MIRQSANRYVEALSVIGRRPLSALAFASARWTGARTPCQLDFRGLKLWVRPGSPDLKVIRSCLLGEFDPALALATDRHRLIIDAGGYIGVAAILFAERFPGSKVLCLEPSTENFALARKNCAPWRNIEVLNMALAPASGTVALRDRGTGPWGFTIAEAEGKEPQGRDLGIVEAIAMPDLIAREGASGVDLLKLDIEGGEFALLKDRPDWVARCDLIVAELHDRICAGATRAFIHATEGRQDVWMRGEKRISLAPGIRPARP